MMTDFEYQEALKKAENELADLKRQRQQVDLRISRLEQTIAGLRALTDPDFESDVGLTDAIRHVLRASQNLMRPSDVRAGLQAMGKSVEEHTNPMASIHAILARLIKSREVMEFSGLGSGKYYWWTLNGPPPPLIGNRTQKAVEGLSMLHQLFDPSIAQMAQEIREAIDEVRKAVPGLDAKTVEALRSAAADVHLAQKAAGPAIEAPLRIIQEKK